MSFVGNEYWAGSTATSSDPAAASCTQVAIMSCYMMMEITIMIFMRIMMTKMKKDKVTNHINFGKIPELLNPWVNPVFCGANSRLVTKEGKLITLKEHQNQH